VILSAASSLYGAVALRRRRWFARPSRQRRLGRAVVSIGNLSVGGSGKTPVVEHVVRLLQDAGERPAILSRGYARRIKSAAVTLVATGAQVVADLDHAGDEPLMLARTLPGVPVLVGADRFACGLQAEQRFDVTVHVLDDGFQHLKLWRDVNLLLIDEDDLAERVLPAGRLREPLSAAVAADAILMGSGEPSRFGRAVAALGVPTVFRTERTLVDVHMMSSGKVIEPQMVGPVFAVAGIAKPHRLFETLASRGWRLGGTLVFRDHHRFSQSDVSRISQAARDAQTHIVITTSKDAVRFEPLDYSPLALAVATIATGVEPASTFAAWLRDRLSRARAQLAGGARGPREAGGSTSP
jgi:tetraacyldisaccharide 4'-kinase